MTPPRPSNHFAHARLLAALTGTVVLAALSLFVLASPASASHKQVSILDATQEALGFKGDAIRTRTFDDVDELGVDYIRILVWWKNYAPGSKLKQKPGGGFDPADSSTYGANGANFAGLDAAVRLADARGIGVYLVPSMGPTNGAIPRWAARRPGAGAYDPKPGEYEAFFHAIGERYGGSYDPDGVLGDPVLPRVRMMGVNNEPNAENYLFPQERKGKVVGPTTYRNLFLAARRGLSDGGWQGKVLIGETAPRGVLKNVAPVAFLRGVLCLNSHYKRKKGCAPLKATAWAHHPYGLSQAPWDKRVDSISVTLGVIERMTTALNKAAAAGAIRKNLPLFISEYAFQSRPADKFGLPLAKQTEYLSQAERLAYENGRIGSFAQYLMRDDAFKNGFQSGLRTTDSGAVACGGAKQGCKPAFAGFRTPLAVRQRGSKASIWGHIRPATGKVTVTIRVQDKGEKLRVLRTLKTDANGYFSFNSAFRADRRWGINWEGLKSPMVRGYRY
ncbi:MAG: hypothetical protein EXQ70_07725 [Solirubrobacterales bacterium]|nr:hypothetical protein [Solirubrobacterales bacterium]